MLTLAIFRNYIHKIVIDLRSREKKLKLRRSSMQIFGKQNNFFCLLFSIAHSNFWCWFCRKLVLIFCWKIRPLVIFIEIVKSPILLLNYRWDGWNGCVIITLKVSLSLRMFISDNVNINGPPLSYPTTKIILIYLCIMWIYLFVLWSYLK